MVLFFSVRGEGKMLNNFIKKKFFFSLLYGTFSLFLVVRFPQKIIR